MMAKSLSLLFLSAQFSPLCSRLSIPCLYLTRSRTNTRVLMGQKAMKRLAVLTRNGGVHTHAAFQVSQRLAVDELLRTQPGARFA
jgi:hypothetical protein